MSASKALPNKQLVHLISFFCSLSNTQLPAWPSLQATACGGDRTSDNQHRSTEAAESPVFMGLFHGGTGLFPSFQPQQEVVRLLRAHRAPAFASPKNLGYI